MSANFYLCLLLVTGVYLPAITCYGLTFKATHEEIEPYVTTNVSLSCLINNETIANGLYAASRLRILKYIPDSGMWETLAEIRDNEDAVQITQDYKRELWVSAHIEKLNAVYNKLADGYLFGGNNAVPISDTRLEIIWHKASNLTIGSYKCDVIGFSYNNDVIWEKSSALDIWSKEELSLRDVRDLALKQRSELEQIIKLQGKETEQLCLGKLQEISKDLEDTKKMISTLFDVWPEGTYGIPRPKSGCPLNVGAQWVTGYRKHQEDSGAKNKKGVSEPNNLWEPVKLINGNSLFTYQHFCMVASTSQGPAWPSGSYCIAKKGNDCPANFDEGKMVWDDAFTGSKTSGTLPEGVYVPNFTTMIHCCRSDGSPTTPIFLPTAKPFYLYRYQGVCQNVMFMNVTNEFIYFDTEDVSNDDGYNSYVHPDGKANHDVRLELCYYERS